MNNAPRYEIIYTFTSSDAGYVRQVRESPEREVYYNNPTFDFVVEPPIPDSVELPTEVSFTYPHVVVPYGKVVNVLARTAIKRSPQGGVIASTEALYPEPGGLYLHGLKNAVTDVLNNLAPTEG